MAKAEKTPTAEPPALPDFYTNPNSVLGDSSVSWRYGKPPDYSKTRKVFAETKSMNHAAGSLPQLVENLVKNWEIEASFKTKLEDWRTVNHSKYTFSMNGDTPQTAHHMLNVGTYNAIIAPNEFYSPENSDFASSHKTFKRMMPTFAWEVLEAYSGPPKVAFRWRHWGEMKNDYVGFNNRAEKVTAKAHSRTIDIQGVTVADLDKDMKIVHLETWFDPMDMFRQIAPEGIVNKQTVDPKYPNGSLHKSDFVPEDTASLAPALQKHVDVSEAIKASEEHSTVIDNSVHRRKYERSGECTLADHEPGGPQLPHESSQETTSASDVSEGSSESMDAQEHEVLTAKALADKTLFQANTGDKAESVSVLTSSEDQLGSQSKKCKVYSDESISKTESDVVEGRIKSESSEAKITFEVGHAEVKPGEGDAKIEGAKIENAQIKADGGVRQVDSDEAEAQAKPDEAGAVAASKRSLETKITHEEMNRITPAECPFLNRE